MPTSSVVLHLAGRRLARIRADPVLCSFSITGYTAEGLGVVLHALVNGSPSKFIASAISGFSSVLNFWGRVRLDLSAKHLPNLILLSRSSLGDHLNYW